MSNYVTLTNLLLTRMNEVTLDGGGEGFDSVRGVQALAKNAINNSIRLILQDGQEWPFLKKTYVQTLTAGVREYNYPADFSSSDVNTFYLKASGTSTHEPSHLRVLSFEEYTQDFRKQDDLGEEGVPELLYQTYEEKFGVSPNPDSAYEIEYVYWSAPSDLVAYDEDSIVPTRFNHVLVDGAMMFMMRFRSNDQSAAMHESSFREGIRSMRRVLLDDIQEIRSTVISGRS